MSGLAFELRFAWRNITGSIGRSLVVFFTMTVVAALAVTGFSIDDSFRQLFTLDERETYLDVDLVMTYDANSTTRIMNKRTIAEAYADRFTFFASFFNFYAVLETETGDVYANVMSSSVAEMERVVKTDLPSLAAGEAVLPASFATEQELSEGDVFDLFLAGTGYSFIVKAIVDDVGLFAEKTIFIDKVELLKLVYGASNLGNLGNTVYFDLAPDADMVETIALLSAEPEYASFVFTEVVDAAAIARMATFNSSIFLGIGIMAIVALVLVLRSVFPVLFRDFAAQIGVVKTLGGSDRFAFRVWIWQFAIILAAAIPFGLFLAWFGFNLSRPFVGVEGMVTLNPLLSGAAVLSVLAVVFLELVLRFFRLRKLTAVSLSTDRRSEKEPAQIILCVAALFAFAISRIVGWNATTWGSLAETVFVLVFAFTGSGLLLKVIALIVRRTKKPSAFGLFTVRHLAADRIAHNALKVATMAIVVIAVTLMLNNFIVVATATFEDQVKADYVLTNIFDYDPSLKADIIERYQPESIDEASFYTKCLLRTEGGEKRLRFVFSLRYEDIATYFDFAFDPSVGARFADMTQPYVLLSVSLGRIYNLHEGDEVTLAISKDLPEATFVVAGFIDTYFDSIAITNLVNVPAYADVAPVNALLINTLDGDVATGMVRDYSSRMYFLLDVRETVAENVAMFRSVSEYLVLLGWAVAFCFMVVILNNAVLVFDAMKADYARLITLGAGPGRLYGLFAAEAGILALIAAAAATMIVLVFFPAMPELMLLFDNYKIIPLDYGKAFLAIGGGLLVFLIGYGTYFVKVRRMRITDEIKKY